MLFKHIKTCLWCATANWRWRLASVQLLNKFSYRPSSTVSTIWAFHKYNSKPLEQSSTSTKELMTLKIHFSSSTRTSLKWTTNPSVPCAPTRPPRVRFITRTTARSVATAARLSSAGPTSVRDKTISSVKEVRAAAYHLLSYIEPLPVWPDVRIKSHPIFTKVAQEGG